MSRTLSLQNRQRVRRVDTRLLRRITLHILAEELGLDAFELGIHLVNATEMARVNSTFLQHEGSTDVITFDHSEPSPTAPLHGELYICLDDAVAQAREFRSTWTSELARYVIHGILHLRGHDDLQAAARRKMKREENLLLRRVAKTFSIPRLELPRTSR